LRTCQVEREASSELDATLLYVFSNSCSKFSKLIAIMGKHELVLPRPFVALSGFL
jgi:hypothetical protein